ncbi:pyrimidine/purine nucleoside phosphorylase [Colwelliaceae bacterium 6471]
MNEFNNVTITKMANIYFDGKVTSRAITLADGSTKTLGIMMLGEYEFATSVREVMEILAGDVEVLLPNSSTWQQVTAGQTFEVPANAKFNIRAKTLTDYCCSYL